MMENWEELASVEVGSEGQPGSQYALTHVTITRRGKRYRATARHAWGSNQGYLEEHGCHETEGRGETPAEAVEALRKDVLAWAENDEVVRAEYASAMRRAVYEAEDAEAAQADE